jgi:hypothetical protein
VVEVIDLGGFLGADEIVSVFDPDTEGAELESLGSDLDPPWVVGADACSLPP